MRRQIGELHRKIKAQVVALERGIEPEGLGANRAVRGSRTLEQPRPSELRAALVAEYPQVGPIFA
jgi:hypothetical protein